MVLGVCWRRLGDVHAAEDAFQATFLVLVRRAGRVRVGVSLGPWLHGVARKVAERARADAARRLVRERPDPDVVARAVARPDHDAARRDLAGLIDDEVGRLPEKYRLPIVLCHFEGLTHDEAAQRLGCPSGTVAIRLMRARARLKGRLARRGAAPDLTLAGLARDVVPLHLIDTTTAAATGAGAFATPVLLLAQGVIRAMFQAHLRKLAATIGLAGVVLAGTALAVARRAEVSDPAKFVSGRVVDDQGEPIPGAGVWLSFGFEKDSDRTPHAVADEAGRFALPIPEATLGDPNEFIKAGIWAVAPGHTIGTARAQSRDKPAEVVVALGPATDTAFKVVGPGGRPIIGARVNPYLIMSPNRAYMPPPRGMIPQVGGTTDAKGRVVLPALGRADLSSVEVVAEGFGRQTLRLNDRADEPAERTVRLRAVGRVEGRIVADRPEQARGVTLYFTTEAALNLGSWQAEGLARVVTDLDGRFAVPALAAGKLRIEGAVDAALPVRLRLPDALTVRPDDATRFDIPLVPAVKVRGIVRAHGSNEPLAGAQVSVRYGTYRQSELATSGADGTYQARVLPGQVYRQVIVTPDGFVQMGAPWAEDFAVPADDGTFDLPPIDLVKAGPPIPGRLVDGRDRPLAGLRVFASHGNRRYGFAQTDAEGLFTLEGVPVGLEFTYEAWSDDESAVPAEVVTAAPLLLRARMKAEAIAAAGPDAAISGRVIDREGKPVAGARLFLREKLSSHPGFAVTDAEGRFRKPFAVAKGVGYWLIVEPGDVAVAAGPETHFDGKGPLDFPAIVCDRLRSIAGTVVDGQGKPIAGAVVSNRGNASMPTSTVTEDDGRFLLDGVPAGSILLFAEAPGFRFRGGWFDPAERSPRIVLKRAGEPSGRSVTPIGPVMTAEEAKALASGLIAGDVDRVLAGDDRNLQGLLLDALAWIDPSEALARIATGEKRFDRDASRIGVFQATLATDPEAARGLLPLIKSPYYRLHGYEELFDAIPDDQPERRWAILADGIAEARVPDNADRRAGFLARFGRRMVDLGDVEEARRLLAGIDPPGNPRTAVVVALALGRVDPARAEAMIPEGGDERERNDLIGAVAEAVAAIDPARAERLFGRYTWQSSSVFKVHGCARMATVDLARARRVAETITSEVLHAYAFALMAEAVAAIDPRAASALLDDMTRAFGDAVAHGQAGGWFGPVRRHDGGFAAAGRRPGLSRPARRVRLAGRLVPLAASDRGRSHQLAPRCEPVRRDQSGGGPGAPPVPIRPRPGPLDPRAGGRRVRGDAAGGRIPQPQLAADPDGPGPGRPGVGRRGDPEISPSPGSQGPRPGGASPRDRGQGHRRRAGRGDCRRPKPHHRPGSPAPRKSLRGWIRSPRVASPGPSGHGGSASSLPRAGGPPRVRPSRRSRGGRGT